MKTIYAETNEKQALLKRPGISAKEVGWEIARSRLNDPCEKRFEAVRFRVIFSLYRFVCAIRLEISHGLRPVRISFPPRLA
jgi:hypothetical protein